MEDLLKSKMCCLIDTSTHPETRCSVSEIKAKIESVKEFLIQLGLPYQSRVALLGQNSLNYFSSLLGIREAGLVAVPINCKAPADYILGLAQESEARLFLGDPELRRKAPQHIQWIDFSHVKASASQSSERSFPKDRTALTVFTSGQSGTAKGVAIPEKSRRAFAMASVVQHQMSRSSSAEEDRTLIATPLSHILAINLTESLFATEQSFALMPTFDAKNFLEAIRKHEITRLSMIPSMWAMILRDVPDIASHGLSRIRHIFFSSEPLTERILSSASHFFPNAFIENAYGISEAGPNLFGPHPQGNKRPGLSVGYPRKGISYRIVDGELEIKTPFMLKEYLNNPLLTRDALTADGFYKTKDLFSVDGNGFFFFKGRKDNMIISGGRKFYPREVEEELERIVEIERCAAVAIADPMKGESPFAFVTLKSKETISETELQKRLATRVPAHMIPKKIWILPELPITENLKIDRTRLKEMATDLLAPKSSN